jgi:hypothetical protein
MRVTNSNCDEVTPDTVELGSDGTFLCHQHCNSAAAQCEHVTLAQAFIGKALGLTFAGAK